MANTAALNFIKPSYLRSVETVSSLEAVSAISKFVAQDVSHAARRRRSAVAIGRSDQ